MNKTIVFYKSGRHEILNHKNKREMLRDREALTRLDTVASFRSPKLEELVNR